MLRLVKQMFEYLKNLIDKIRGVEQVEPLVTNMEEESLPPVLPKTQGVDKMADQISGSSEKFINELVSTFMSIDGVGEVLAAPTYIINGSGYAWFYNPNTRSMARVSRGSEVFLYKNQKDAKGRVYGYVGELLLAIPEEDLVEIGHN